MDEEVSIADVKRAIQVYHDTIQQIEVKRLGLWHDEMYAWGVLQKVLSHNVPVMRNYDECYVGD